jgi:hypothetical protein
MWLNRRPSRSRRMLWHLCDIYCQSDEMASGELVRFVAATDYDNARAFYEGKLGFEFVSLDRNALVMRAGEDALRISKLPFTPRGARFWAGRCRTLKARPPGSTTKA